MTLGILLLEHLTAKVVFSYKALAIKVCISNTVMLFFLKAASKESLSDYENKSLEEIRY